MSQRKKSLDHEEMARMASPTPGNTHLMAIAVDAYAHCPKLSNCVKDAKDFVGLMQERYQVAPERTYTLYDGEVTRKQVLQALKQLRSKIGSDDSLLVFFSGHGEVEDEHAFWVPVEGKPGEDDDWISAADIKRRLNAINSFHTLLIVDACFSGSFFLSFKAGTRELLGSLRSRLGISASHSRERALDGRPGQNSPFAQELLGVLRRNQQPLPTDQLYTEVRDAVMQRTQGRQTPIFRHLDVKGDDQGQYVFLPQANDEAAWAAIAALPDETLKEVEAKRAALRRFCQEQADSPHFDAAVELGEDLDHKREFLRKYDSEFGLLRFALKDTPYRKAAQKRLAELQAQAAEPPDLQPEPQPKPEPKPEPAPKPPAGFIRIPGGTFQMGGEAYDSEKPIHEVRVSDFYLSKHPVTFADYDAYCEAAGKEKPDDEGWGRGQRPVIKVSWNDAIAYCNWRSEKEGLTKVYTIRGEEVSAKPDANGYRLPTEAEWEYAARGAEAGAKDGFTYAGSNDLDEVGWYSKNSGGKTQPVGQKKPNQLGLYDMSGNVWEWCEDDWHDNYNGAPRDGRAWVDSPRGGRRVLRGGSWYCGTGDCRVAVRLRDYPTIGSYFDGFRLARD